MKKKENVKLKKFLNILYVLFVLLIFSVLIQLIYENIFNSYKPNEELIVNYDLSKDIIPDPIQKNIDNEKFSLEVRGIDVDVTKLATYDITGKVEGIKDYNTNAIASILAFKGMNVIDYISPIDLALSWGNVALEENSEHFYADQYNINANRMVYFTYDNYLKDKYGENYITSHFSNNHVITLDKNFRNVLSKIKVNDVVRMKGYLVYVKCSNGSVWGPSSLIRTDTGSHACEILYLEDIVVMP